MPKEYKVDKQTLQDIQAFEPRNRNKRQVFITNSVRATIDTMTNLKSPPEEREHYATVTINYCNGVLDALDAQGVEFKVMELPSVMFPYATLNNEPPEIEMVPALATSTKCTLEDFKSFLKFISKKRCLALYMVMVHPKLEEGECILRLALLTYDFIEENAKFIVEAN